MHTLKLPDKARRVAKLVRHILQGQIFTQRSIDFKHQQRAYARATLLVQAYYVFLLFDFTNMAIGLWRQAAVATSIKPLWPVFWSHFFDGKNIFAVVICRTLGGGRSGRLPAKQTLDPVAPLCHFSLC